MVAHRQPPVRCEETRSRPKLSLRLKRHPDAAKIRRADLVLPKSLVLVRSKARRRVSGQRVPASRAQPSRSRGKRRLSVTGLGKQGASSLLVRLGGGSLKARGRLRKALRIKVVATDVRGKRVTGRARIRVRR